MAQVQGCLAGRRGGQQVSASTTVLCVWVAPPQRQQGASTLSISGIPSRAAPACARSSKSKGAGADPAVATKGELADGQQPRFGHPHARGAVFRRMNDPDAFDRGQLLCKDALQKPWIDAIALPVRERGKVP